MEQDDFKWTKKLVLKFAEWVSENTLVKYSHTHLWEMKKNTSMGKQLTDDQLYTLFLQSLNK